MPFREPVDWRGLGLYDYPQVISKPMDLLTVKQTIEKNGYKSINDCADDARPPVPGCGSLRRGLAAISLLTWLVTSVRTAVTSW